MISYASRTGTRRNLAELARAGWRLLVSCAGEWRTEGFPYALDNGQWSDFQAGRLGNPLTFDDFLAELGAGADFVVAPDIVGGGLASLHISSLWLERCLEACRLVLIPVQDGMAPADLAPFVGPRVGLFLGGSTEWKLATLAQWGAFTAARGCHYHVGRVNSECRIAAAAAAGADSIDGSSASRFAVNVRRLDFARRQADLFAPTRANQGKLASRQTVPPG
jgi:hypothetical protein